MKKQKEKGLPPKGTGPINLFTKRKLSDKTDRPPKKPKVVTGSIVKETLDSNKLPPPPRPRKGKGVMTGQGSIIEKRPVLLHEDSRYAIKQLSSIIKDDDYEDFGNHATEAMGETCLFSLTRYANSSFSSFLLVITSFSNFRSLFLQGVLMMKGLMDLCISQETVVGRLREKVETTKTELRELYAWREVQLQKFDMTKKSLEESEKQAKALGNILKNKEDEISKLKKQLHRAKEDTIKEYRNSDASLYKLGGSFVDGFDNCLHQVKASFPILDLSQISIDA